MINNLSTRLKDQRGFNLIELMIVIAIIGLLIGVGSLAWQAVIKSGNENAAAQSIDKLRTYQAQYAARNKGTFATFDELRTKLQLDERFTGEAPVVNGYTFTMTVTPAGGGGAAKYEVWADPQSTGATGTGARHFYTSSSLSSIRGTDEDRKAKEDDPSI
jgi:prepilin-type N-terminal cleavage/methylation domain-containing protein